MRLAHEIVKRIDLAKSIWKKWDGQREVLLKSALCCLAPGTGKTKTGRLWVYVRDDRPFCGQTPPAAVYFFSPDRGGEHPARHMASFTGFLQADGYAGFEALFDTTRTPITEVACWAHCRRKFFDVWEATKLPVAREALDRIGALYASDRGEGAVRSSWRTNGVNPEAYLRDTLTKIANGHPNNRIDELLPWQTERPEMK